MEWGLKMGQRPDWIQVKGKGSMKPYFFQGKPTVVKDGEVPGARPSERPRLGSMD
jgi:hypothetical protein